jgi:hypothetical protein
MTNSPPELNTRMPFMPFNWFIHSTRVCRLSLPERGLFDAVRAELWTVVGCKLRRDTIMSRLRIEQGSSEAGMLDSLIRYGLPQEDSEGQLFDALQVQEFEEAVAKAEQNRRNGAKGGRPRKGNPGEF